MGRTLYFDCFSGVAGDMTLGALIDLGVSADGLRDALGRLDLPSWTLDVREKMVQGLRAVDVHVVVGGRTEGPSAATSPDHHHGHDHHHDHDTHGFSYAEICALIDRADLPHPVHTLARQAFDTLAAAEGRVHGVEPADVHFHELGAVDSVVDICGSAWGIWQLGLDRIVAAPPPIARGFVNTAHGRMPLPAPATSHILEGLPIEPCPLRRELVTPTGAAFLKAWADEIGPIPAMTLEKIGWGAGDATLPDRPNLLRLMLGRTHVDAADRWVVESNLDDLNPEWAGYLLERVFEAGALDAWFTPIQMKKNRPALQVSALCEPGRRAAIEAVMLGESTAIGLRRYPVSRHVLERRVETVQTPFGPIQLKIAGEGPTNVAPEFESCAAAARAHGVPLKRVYQHAVAAFLGREIP